MPAAKTDPEPSSRSTFSKIGFRTTQINLYEREINIRKMGIGDVCCYIFMLSTKVRSLGRIFEIAYSQSDFSPNLLQVNYLSNALSCIFGTYFDGSRRGRD